MSRNQRTVVGRHKGGSRGVGVALREGESIESLLSRFKREVIQTGILEEYKEHQVFVKPSVTARLKRSKRKRNARLSNIY